MRTDKLAPACILAYLLPSIVGIYAALNFLETNIAVVRSSDAILLFSVMAGFGAAITLIFRATSLGPFKSALISSLIVILTVYGFIIFRVLSNLSDGLVSFWATIVIFVVLLALISLGLARAKATFKLPVQFVAVLVIVSSGFAITNIIIYEADRSSTANTNSSFNADLAAQMKFANKKPNIFYIILDRYGDQRTLTADYNFDNSEFTAFMRKNGFFVATESASNYPFTAQSVSSSLNMDYHNFTAEQIPSHKNDLVPFIRLLQENSVTRYLQNIGYKYVHMGSWWGPSEASPIADENFRTTSLGQFDRKFLLRSIFAPLYSLSNNDASSNSIDPDQCSRVPQKLKRLQELAASKDPTFTFAHFLVPHDPFVFDKNGRCLEFEESASRSLEESYLAQLQYANKFLTSLIEGLLSQPGPKPIIIIQADEGPYPTRYRKDQYGFQWASATDQEIRQKSRILNAYYFPQVGTEIFYNQITPVNSFRLLFNSYFGTSLALLPDRNYAIPSNSNRYDFFDVTDIVR
ncbi:MAG: sulfatase-like hydrolase/transferase [Sneathiella sp.]